MISANSKRVFEYVTEHDGDNFTAKDIAAALGLEPRSVNAIVTAFGRRKNEVGVPTPLMVRVQAEIELPDGFHDKVKFIQLTDAGREFDINAAE